MLLVMMIHMRTIVRTMLTVLLFIGLPIFVHAQSVVLKGSRKTSWGYAFDGASIKDTSKTYVIHQKLDLKGKTITLPAGTKLLFDGGMLGNGVILPQGGPIHILNPSDATILQEVYFQNEESEGYQKRCCTGKCKDTWFSAKDDDDLFNMACAFDGVILTHKEYHLKQHSSFSEKSYPEKYRLLSKSFSIRSSCPLRSVLHTDGQLTIIRQSFYGRDEDLGLSIQSIDVQADGYAYTRAAFAKESTANRCFFGGALNNFGHTFDLTVKNCRLKGVFQLMQWNCYNDGLNVEIQDSEFDCGSFGMEVYNGNDFRKLKMVATNSIFRSYDAYVFSLVAVDADVKFHGCQVDGIELYHKGMVSFQNCNIQKYLTHSGDLVQGIVLIDNCKLQQRDFACESLVFTIKGMKKVQVTNSSLYVDNGVLTANRNSSNPVLLNIQRCEDVVMKNTKLETDASTSLLKSMNSKMALLWGDGSEKQVSRRAIDKGNLKSYLR